MRSLRTTLVTTIVVGAAIAQLGRAAPALRDRPLPKSDLEGTTWTGTYQYPNNPSASPVTVTFDKTGNFNIAYQHGSNAEGKWKVADDKLVVVEVTDMVLQLKRNGNAFSGTSKQGQDGPLVQWNLKRSE